MRSILITILLLLAGTAQAAILEIATHEEGRGQVTNDSGLGCFPGHDPDGTLYCSPTLVNWKDDVAIGRSTALSDFGNNNTNGNAYHVFDLSGVDGYVESASFKIWLGIDGYTHAEVPYLSDEDFDYGGNRETVIRTDDNPYTLSAFLGAGQIMDWKSSGGVPVYDYPGSNSDLSNTLSGLVSGSVPGPSYGSVLVEEDDEGSWIVVTLNSLAVQEINDSRGSDFGVMGTNFVPWGCTAGYSCNDYMFTSPDSGNAVLTLNVTAVPIPAAVWLFG